MQGGFHNGEILNDRLVGGKLLNVEITARSESYGKGNCQVCDFICNTDTFSTKACSGTFKVQSEPRKIKEKKLFLV